MPLSKNQIIDLLAGLVITGNEIVVAAALTYAAMKTWSEIISTPPAIWRIGKANLVPISDLRTFLLESEYPKEKLVVVSGFVKGILQNQNSTPNILVSKETGKTGVVLQQTWASVHLGDWINDLFRKPWNSQKNTSFQTIPFVLSGRGHHDYVVVNLEGSTQPLPLTTIIHRSHGKFYDSNLPIGEFFFGPVLLEEKLLQFGRVISAVGYCSLQDGYPQIKSCNWLPYFLSDLTTDQMIEYLTHRMENLFVRGIILGLLSFGFLSYIYMKYCSMELRRDIPNEQLCAMCLRRTEKSVGVPCKHVVCCERCAYLFQQISEPECRYCRRGS